MARKFIYLLLALILPGAIFVFLKVFGRNEFTIPVYYQQGVDDVSETCQFNYQVPYVVPDSIMNLLAEGDKAILLVANPSSQVRSNLSHVTSQLEKGEYQIVYATNAGLPWDEWYSCFLFLYKPWSAVLIDSENQIRGYYDPETREEADRLTVELKILLRQY